MVSDASQRNVMVKANPVSLTQIALQTFAWVAIVVRVPHRRGQIVQHAMIKVGVRRAQVDSLGSMVSDARRQLGVVAALRKRRKLPLLCNRLHLTSLFKASGETLGIADSVEERGRRLYVLV